MTNFDNLQTIRGFLPITDQWATSGQPKISHFHTIADAGFECVINLLPDSEVLSGEPELVRELGMEYHAIPVIWTEPTPENFDAFVALMQAYSERKLYVHCAANMRVSAFTYLYRTLFLGVDETTARAEMHKIWEPTFLWTEFITAIKRGKA
jgi:protein tyrosine phosphatase (PTP) superfamily phosphohydrolase (DUF442 family)